MQLGGQVLLRRLGLGVLLEVPGGVLLRRQPDIQRDIHIGAVLVVVVLGGEAALPPLHAVEIGGDQLAADPQVISVQTGGQLLLLRRQLAAHTVAGGGGGLQQIPSLLLHPLRLLPLFVEVVQQVGKAVVDLRLGVGAILGNRAVGKVRQRPIPFDKRRCKGVSIHIHLPPGEHIPQGVSLRYGGVGAAAGADCQLPRHQRGHGGEGVQQPAVQRCVRRGAPQQGGKLLLRHGQRRALILSGGQAVKKPRQHLPVLLRLQIHATQTVDDPAVPVAEDEIGAAGHPLPHQRKAAALSHLVGGQHGQRHHTLQRLLPDGLDDAAGQVLAQEHTEHRRLGWVIPQLLRQVDAGLVGPGVEEQAAAAPQQEDDLIPCGLLYFFDAAAGELGGSVDGGVAPTLEHRLLLRRQQRQDALGAAGLLRGADQRDGGTVQILAGGLAVGAQPCAHQQLIHGVTHMGKADGADGAELILRKGYMKVIHTEMSPFVRIYLQQYATFRRVWQEEVSTRPGRI